MRETGLSFGYKSTIYLIPKWRPINYLFVCMLISPLRLVIMCKKQKNFEVKMRRRGLINMQTKEQFMGRHFGIRCINGFYEGNNQWKRKIQIISVSEKRRTLRAVFKLLSKNQNQSNYSDQSQQERRAPWTNHNSWQSPVTRSKRGKNHAHVVRLVLVLILIGWKTGASLLSQSLSVAIAIT